MKSKASQILSHSWCYFPDRKTQESDRFFWCHRKKTTRDECFSWHARPCPFFFFGLVLFYFVLFVISWLYMKPAQSTTVGPVERVRGIKNKDINPVCLSLSLSPGRSDSDLPGCLWGPSVSPETRSACSLRLAQAGLPLHSVWVQLQRFTNIFLVGKQAVIPQLLSFWALSY